MEAKSFSCIGGFPDIKRSLLERGWQDLTTGACCSHATLQWTCRKSDIDFSSLRTGQWANHYENISQLCTKVGLNNHLRNFRGLCEGDVDVFYPRTFHLSGHNEVDAFVNEYKLQKVEGILKEWLKHTAASQAACETFSEEVVCIALKAAKRHLADIDLLLDEEDNEATMEGFSMSEKEWAVLKEVDIEHPKKDLKELDLQKQNRRDQELNRQQLKQAFSKQVSDLQRMASLVQEKAAKKQQEKLRKQALQQKLSNKVLRQSKPTLPPLVSRSTDEDESAVPEEDTDSTSVLTRLPEPATKGKLDRDEEEEVNLTGEALFSEVRKTLDAWREACPQFQISGTRNMWIMKPAGRARGVGIFVSTDLEKMVHIAQSARDTTTWICQKYIENPLLLDGRKHDIRQWVLVTSWDPLVAYFFGECYIRIAADDYVVDDNNNLRHLTNNAIAHTHPMFDKDDDYWRCMWEQSQYQDFLSRRYGKDAWQKKVCPAMKQAVIDTLTSVQDTLSESRAASSCFELLGYDFLVDAELGVWLLEVNTSPSMEYSTSITRRLVPEVLEDSLKVILGDGPPDAPFGKFELLLEGPRIRGTLGNNGTVVTTLPLSVQGQQLQPPAPETSGPSAKEIRESAQRLADRRTKELQALEEKKRARLEKELQKIERKKRLRMSLRKKILGGEKRGVEQNSEDSPKAVSEGHEDLSEELG
mmetsp:Transcript_52513/g.94181  ORF Transcript_52513/g.94181 Transcript_52513/m.94181 type:complete len:700 (+) Transcript_52513:138-2237(+)|eukprot:CAMPEP_0197655074 /NCGR_PEP_ID=MMETSP1338-20131121/39232_1 /TAXON_ID=43686 ORGANISM="Pelagodinium beii, Strain RCC1491" /NCGR_SAMPLE_ID=MMETSP1338 /ASSEMBLY_ACC=CAM_ASM_000754 /LENGTH=699 /DNA_ID=CAMNT_0043230645 /DNA_START=114 /DNA_END=2213 /DNA_ORIENTATION=-